MAGEEEATVAKRQSNRREAGGRAIVSWAILAEESMQIEFKFYLSFVSRTRLFAL